MAHILTMICALTGTALVVFGALAVVLVVSWQMFCPLADALELQRRREAAESEARMHKREKDRMARHADELTAEAKRTYAVLTYEQKRQLYPALYGEYGPYEKGESDGS